MAVPLVVPELLSLLGSSTVPLSEMALLWDSCTHQWRAGQGSSLFTYTTLGVMRGEDACRDGKGAKGGCEEEEVAEMVGAWAEVFSTSQAGGVICSWELPEFR